MAAKSLIPRLTKTRINQDNDVTIRNRRMLWCFTSIWQIVSKCRVIPSPSIDHEWMPILEKKTLYSLTLTLPRIRIQGRRRSKIKLWIKDWLNIKHIPKLCMLCRYLILYQSNTCSLELLRFILLQGVVYYRFLTVNAWTGDNIFVRSLDIEAI